MLNKNKKCFKIFTYLMYFILFDAILLKNLGIPFFGAGILAPVLLHFFEPDKVIELFGLYSGSWVFFGIIAYICKPDKKNFETSKNKDI